jgi:LTXXQ motif family protein
MKRLTLPVGLLLATVSAASWAQSPADHEAHHPDQKEAPAAAQPSPPPGQPGMMGQGKMGGPQGMMGGRGMMDGNMPMGNMMRGMMEQSGAETGCAGMSGMATIDRVEGRIAFLKTELKITDAQSAAWNAFADALRTNARSLGEVRASMMPQVGAGQQGLVDRIALQEKWLAARLEGTRAIKSALTNLVGTLSDEQKKTADELLAPHMGMGAMARAMQSGQMGPGQMQPGAMMQGR